MEQSEDDDFLADLTGFLDEYEALHPPIEAGDTATVLYQDSSQLLAETEALLSSTNSLRAQVARETTVREALVLQPHKTLADQQREMKSGQAAKRRLNYREKVKNERQILQEEGKYLSEELSCLQHARKKAKSLGDTNSPGSVWRALATRQKEGRLVAEEQQRRLKTAVDSRANMIQEIGEMMRDKFNSTGMVSQRSSLHITADDTALFEEFLHDLDVLHARTDEIILTSGVGDVPLMFYKKEPEIKRDGDVVYVDNLDVLPIPFSFEETCSVMWHSMVQVYRQRDRPHYGAVVDPENTIAVKLRLQVLGKSGDPVDMMVLFVIRRYVEANRMVLVWRALSDGEGECAGLHSDESGWCIVRPNVDESSIMRTVMETFVRFIPIDVGKKSVDEVDAYQFTKLVVTSAEEDAGEIARMMDSLLI